MNYQGKNNKYGVSPKVDRTINGIMFASKLEMDRYLQLKFAEKAGVIKDLILQPSFWLIDDYVTRDGEKIRGIKYLADFQYIRISDGAVIIEDAKSTATRTKEFLIKKKLLLWRYPLLNFYEVPTANSTGGLIGGKK